MFDLVVIGGGITGAGVLLEATKAGLKCLLIEADSLGGKTTMISSGLIHGGLRYLTHDSLTTQICCEEAGIIKSKWPNLLCRQVFLWSVYRGQRLGLDLIEALMEGYDDFSPLKMGKAHVRLSREEALTVEPNLNPNGLEGTVSFDEWKVNPLELVQANINEAVGLGAQVWEKTRVVGFVRDGKRIAGVRIRKKDAQVEETIEAKVIVNAAGPWAERVANLAGAQSVRFRLRKGVHLIVKNAGLKYGLLFPAPTGRYIGAYPRGEEIWIGPTDDPFDGDLDDLKVTRQEISRLAEAGGKVLPHVNFNEYRTAVGCRPIIYQKGMGSLLSRDWRLYDHEKLDGVAGFVTIAGGKMTSFRLMAQDACALVLAKLDSSIPAKAPAKHPSHIWVLTRSLGRLVFYYARHYWRQSQGDARQGLALFRKTYGQQSGCCD